MRLKKNFHSTVIILLILCFCYSRKEERNFCLDLQTLIVNVPLPTPQIQSHNKVSADSTVQITSTSPMVSRIDIKPLDIDSSYPLALVPGQFCGKYRRYTPYELRFDYYSFFDFKTSNNLLFFIDHIPLTLVLTIH